MCPLFSILYQQMSVKLMVQLPTGCWRTLSLIYRNIFFFLNVLIYFLYNTAIISNKYLKILDIDNGNAI